MITCPQSPWWKRLAGCLAAAAMAASAVYLAATGVPAEAVGQSPGGTGVVEVSAVAGTEGVAVSGRARFVDVPLQVASDPVGDARFSQGVLPLGDDMTGAWIGRPDPFGDMLTFTLDVANQPDDLGGVPETVQYYWFPIVDNGDGIKATQLLATRTQAWNMNWWDDPTTSSPLRTDAEPVFRVGGPWWIAVGSPVAGTMGDGVVQWQVPMDTIDARPGSQINTGNRDGYQAGSFIGSYGHVAASLQVPSDPITPFYATYRVPEPVVSVGIAPADTPAQDVLLTTSATVNSDSTFNGSVPTPSEPGEYIVVAQACYGADNCGLSTTTVMVE